MNGAFMLNKKVNNRFRNKAVNIQPCFLVQKQALKETAKTKLNGHNEELATQNGKTPGKVLVSMMEKPHS